MPIRGSKEKDYKPLTTARKAGGTPPDGLRPLAAPGAAINVGDGEPKDLVNLSYNYANETDPRGPDACSDAEIRPLKSDHADARFSQPTSPAKPKTEKK